jgi:hypothetical protein
MMASKRKTLVEISYSAQKTFTGSEKKIAI